MQKINMNIMCIDQWENVSRSIRWESSAQITGTFLSGSTTIVLYRVVSNFFQAKFFSQSLKDKRHCNNAISNNIINGFSYDTHDTRHALNASPITIGIFADRRVSIGHYFSQHHTASLSIATRPRVHTVIPQLFLANKHVSSLSNPFHIFSNSSKIINENQPDLISFLPGNANPPMTLAPVDLLFAVSFSWFSLPSNFNLSALLLLLTLSMLSKYLWGKISNEFVCTEDWAL